MVTSGPGAHRGNSTHWTSQTESQRAASGRGGYESGRRRGGRGRGRGGRHGRGRLAHTPPRASPRRSRDRFKFRIVNKQGLNIAEDLCQQRKSMTVEIFNDQFDATVWPVWTLPESPVVITPTDKLVRSVYFAIANSHNDIPPSFLLGECKLRPLYGIFNVKMDGITPGILMEDQMDEAEKLWYVPPELDRRGGIHRGRGAELWFLFASHFSTVVPLFYVWYSPHNAQGPPPEDEIMQDVPAPVKIPGAFGTPSANLIPASPLLSCREQSAWDVGIASREAQVNRVPGTFGMRSTDSVLLPPPNFAAAPKGFGTPSEPWRLGHAPTKHEARGHWGAASGQLGASEYDVDMGELSGGLRGARPPKNPFDVVKAVATKNRTDDFLGNLMSSNEDLFQAAIISGRKVGRSSQGQDRSERDNQHFPLPPVVPKPGSRFGQPSPRILTSTSFVEEDVQRPPLSVGQSDHAPSIIQPGVSNVGEDDLEDYVDMDEEVKDHPHKT